MRTYRMGSDCLRNKYNKYKRSQSTKPMEAENKSIQSYFRDYKHILDGLKKMEITAALDFQQQLLDISESQPLENLIVSAPQGSGKTLAMLLLCLKKFFNEEEAIMMCVVHSKELSQQIFYLVSTLCKIDCLNLFMKKLDRLSKKAIVIGSPSQLGAIEKKYKEKVTYVVVFEADILHSFGYGKPLELLANTLASPFYKMTCVERTEQLMSFKERHMKKTIKIDYIPPELVTGDSSAVKDAGKSEELITHFFEAGERILTPISLYVSLKFNLVNPKILVLCENLREVYRYYMLLERMHITGIGLYNQENPINLKFYTLSLWMNGNINILLATRSVIDDLNSNVFREMTQKQYRKKTFELFNMTTIITCNLAHLEGYHQHMVDLFHSKPFIMTFVENTPKEIQALQDFIKFEEAGFANVKKKELPITKKELDAFRYRVNDVWAVLGNTKVEQFQKLDFKKKLLRSPDMKSYFAENPKEKEALIKEINKLRKKIDSDGVKVGAFVPDYLIPECLKSAYHERLKELAKIKEQEQTPEYQQKVKRVLRHIDIDEQNPETTDISRLKLISTRKRWKLQHGFKLKKRNKRNEKKGIFEGNS